MKLAIDNDFFCKTVLLGVADSILEAFGTNANECVVLSSMAPQFRNRKKSSSLFKQYEREADELLAATARFPQLQAATIDPTWLNRMSTVDGINLGEAQLLAYVASTDAILLCTQDKVCLRAIPAVPGLAAAIAGRVVIVETAMLHLCQKHGVEEIHGRVGPHLHRAKDNGVRACFGGQVSSVFDALNSNIDHLKKETDPQILWMPG